MFEFKVPISAKKIVVSLAVCIVVLIVANLIGQYYENFISHKELELKIIEKFDLDLERNNFPTWYQASTLLLSACLLAITAFVKKNKGDADVEYWKFLSFVFLFLSADEAVSIHEQMTMPLRTAFDLHGFLFLSWVIPAAVAVLFLFAAYYKFLTRLPRITAQLFVIAGIIYVGGAVGIEMIGAKYMEAHHHIAVNPNIFGAERFNYALLTSLEESLEMIGILIFIYALTTHLNFELGFGFAKKKVSDFADRKLGVRLPRKEVRIG